MSQFNVFDLPVLQQLPVWLAIATVKSFFLVSIGLLVCYFVQKTNAAVRFRFTCMAVIGSLLASLIVPFVAIWRLPILPSVIQQGLNINKNTRSTELDSVAGVAGQPINVLHDFQLDFHSTTSGILLSIWFVGFVLCFAYFVFGIWRQRVFKKNFRRVDNPTINNLLSEIASKIGVKQPVNLQFGSNQHPPYTVGWINPSIVIPEKASRWNIELMRSIFAHELAHIRRNDWALQQLVNFSCAIFWFNPLIWLARRLMLEDREFACDQIAVNSKTGIQTTDFATHLLTLASEVSVQPNVISVPFIGQAQPSKLEKRIAGILRSPTEKPSFVKRFRNRFAWIVFCASSIFIFCMTPVESKNHPEFAVYYYGMFSNDADANLKLEADLKSDHSQVREAATLMLQLRNLRNSQIEDTKFN